MCRPKINTHSEVIYFVVLKVYFIQEGLSWCPEKTFINGNVSTLETSQLTYKTFAL